MVEKTTWSDEQIFITIMWRVNWHHEPLMRCPETPASFLWFSCHNVWSESSHEGHCINPVEDHPPEWEACSFQDCQDHKEKQEKTEDCTRIKETENTCSWIQCNFLDGILDQKRKRDVIVNREWNCNGPVLYRCWSSDVMGGLYDGYEGECLCFMDIHTGYLGVIGVKSVVFYWIVHKKTQQQEQNHIHIYIESKSRCARY